MRERNFFVKALVDIPPLRRKFKFVIGRPGRIFLKKGYYIGRISES